MKTDIVDMMSLFKKEVLEKSLPFQDIYEEVRMMKFKVRPLQGDISALDLKNTHFIEILWRLGKLDEFFQHNVKRLPPQQKETFFHVFQEMYEKFQSELNTVSLKHENITDAPTTLEMEIFKDSPSKKN